MNLGRYKVLSEYKSLPRLTIYCLTANITLVTTHCEVQVSGITYYHT